VAAALAEWAASAHCVNYVVGCNCVAEGVAGGLRDVLRHLAAGQPASCAAWLFNSHGGDRLSSWGGKKIVISVYITDLPRILVFGPGRVSVVGLADNPLPELTEVGHYDYTSQAAVSNIQAILSTLPGDTTVMCLCHHTFMRCPRLTTHALASLPDM
jgi:hypothetical protein